jgi:hypothetical protein
MDLSVLDSPAVISLTGLMVSDLQQFDAQLDVMAATLKARKGVLHALLSHRFEEAARAQLTAAKKDTGTATLVSNGITVKVEFAKKVEWDQAKLMAALNALAPEDAKHYAKVELKVDERKYTAAPPAIQAALKDARTVGVAKPAFSFKIESAEAA